MKQLKVKEVPRKTLFDGFHTRIIHSEKMTTAFVEIEANSELPEHSHPNEQTLVLNKGSLELTVNGIKTTLHEGDLVIIPPDVLHSGFTLTACELQDIFVPRREDWIGDE